MRKLNINLISEGTVLAKPVYGSDNLMLLNKGTVLNMAYIRRLKILGFTALYIEDGLIDDVEMDELINDSTHNRAIECLKKTSQDIGKNMTIQVGVIRDTVTDIIDQVLDNKQMMGCLSDVCSYDDYTFNHSVNVTVLSVMLGICLNYSRERLYDLGMGVLLHDVGKIDVPSQIVTKPGQLTPQEYEMVKQHTVLGFEKLRKNNDIKITSAHVAFQHHERYDGTGYPRGMAGQEIHEFARIAAIADVFDAMGSDRCYRKKIPLTEVCQYLQSMSGKQFDPDILEKFIEKIALYPQGTLVTLSDGRSGLVVKQNSGHPNRPIVRLFWNCDGTDIKDFIEINLLERQDIDVFRVIENIKPPLLQLKDA